jgi:crotonobetainyl-CoA:carnitine CoA-transferase CaiB-like acyl-CoA transferase
MDAPLAGLKVLDLSRLLPGGLCSLMLADLGAEVVKLEDTGAGDYIRWAPPHHEGMPASASSAMYQALNRNKRSIRVNLKSEEGKEVLRRLAREFDVLLESFRPGVMDRLGVGYEELRKHNEGLVFCAISGYGTEHPEYAGRVGHDLNYIALVGVLGLSGERGGPPVPPEVQVADTAGGSLFAAMSILAALRGRESSGQGQFIDVSMTHGVLALVSGLMSRYLCDGNLPVRGETWPICYSPYKAKDGWVTIGALEHKFWRNWCEGVGRPELIEQQFATHGSEAHAAIKEEFAKRTVEEWERFAAERECCVEPVLALDQVAASSLLSERESLIELEDVGADKPVRQVDFPVRFSSGYRAPHRPAPELGEHTEEVLAELGYSADQIASLTESGAIAGRQDAPAGQFLGA